MTHKHPMCEQPGCGRQGFTCYKLEPRNLRERRARLCDVCRRELRFTRVEFARPAQSGTRLPDRGLGRSGV